MSSPLAGPHSGTSARETRAVITEAAPQHCWYAAATSADVGRALLAATVLNRALVLFRATDGTVAALDDCCAHRLYPLSAGRLVANTVRCGYCGFTYDATGACVEVPTQDRLPVGADVRTYPTSETHGTVWIWLGAPGNAAQHRTPDLPWLTSPEWATAGDSLTVSAHYLLLHESFADVTKIPVLAPEIAPPR